jgi:putative transposase
MEEDLKVAKKGHSEEQILRALRQAESGIRVADICREYEISEATYYIWKKKYSGLGYTSLSLVSTSWTNRTALRHYACRMSLFLRTQ